MDDDKPYRHHTLKQLLISWISRGMFGGVTFTVRRGLIKGMRRHGGLSWIPEIGRRSLTPEQSFLEGLELSGKVVFDIGAYQGVFTLFFARVAAQVVSYEPNPLSLKTLHRNIKLNHLGNVVVRSVGLGERPCCATMVWSRAMPGAATISDTSMARSIGSRKHALRQVIHITTLDKDIIDAQLPDPDLVKIDVDGYEMPVLLGSQELLKRSSPDLFIEMHGETMGEKKRNVNNVVSFLTGIGYGSIRHVESGELITIGNCEAAAKGHLFARKTE